MPILQTAGAIGKCGRPLEVNKPISESQLESHQIPVNIPPGVCPFEVKQTFNTFWTSKKSSSISKLSKQFLGELIQSHSFWDGVQPSRLLHWRWPETCSFQPHPTTALPAVVVKTLPAESRTISSGTALWKFVQLDWFQQWAQTLALSRSSPDYSQAEKIVQLISEATTHHSTVFDLYS